MKLLVLEYGSRPPPDSIIVDDACDFPDCLNIDHHVGHSTPQAFSDGFTSTERVVNAIRSGLDTSNFGSVCIRHYDTDGLLAVWAIRNPDGALRFSEQLISMAEYGDFYERWIKEVDVVSLAASSQLQERQGSLLARFKRPGIGKISAQLNSGVQTLERLLTVGPSASYLRMANAVESTQANVTIQGCVGLVVTRRPLRLEQVLWLLPTPVCIAAWRRDRLSSGISILLRPRYSWGYDDCVTGGSPLRALDDLPRFLGLFGRLKGWIPSIYDGAIWRLDTYGTGAFNFDELADRILNWTERMIENK